MNRILLVLLLTMSSTGFAQLIFPPGSLDTITLPNPIFHPRPIIDPNAPTSTSAEGEVTLERFDSGIARITIIGDLGQMYYEHFRYGIEVFSNRPQIAWDRIFGKNFACFNFQNSYMCEAYLSTSNYMIRDYHSVNHDQLGNLTHPATKGLATSTAMLGRKFRLTFNNKIADIIFARINRFNTATQIQNIEIAQALPGSLTVSNIHFQCAKNIRFQMIFDGVASPDIKYRDNFCQLVIDPTDASVTDVNGEDLTLGIFFSHVTGVIMWNTLPD